MIKLSFHLKFFVVSKTMEDYIEDKKKLYTSIIEFVENEEDINNEIYFDKLKSLIKSQQIEGSHEEMEEFLCIIQVICDNHHRNPNFIKRLQQILQQYKEQIKQTLSNNEIFRIFINNKLIVLFLLKAGIITITDSIFSVMMNKIDSNGNRYCHFFYPELENFAGEEKMEDVKKELLTKYPNIFDDYDNNRNEGENDSFICSLIRQDSIEQFISYINRNQISPSSQISKSIFETNSFLISQKSTSLIEYSAFFGSIQIYRYLKMNDVKLTPSLWLYTIHSKNAELIHLLESDQVSPPRKKYGFDDDNEYGFTKCLIESIKCHHNDIAVYIENNKIPQNNLIGFDPITLKLVYGFGYTVNRKVVSKSLQYRNYSYFNDQTLFDFFHLCFYNYNKIVDFLIKKKEDEIKKKII